MHFEGKAKSSLVSSVAGFLQKRFGKMQSRHEVWIEIGGALLVPSLCGPVLVALTKPYSHLGATAADRHGLRPGLARPRAIMIARLRPLQRRLLGNRGVDPVARATVAHASVCAGFEPRSPFLGRIDRPRDAKLPLRLSLCVSGVLRHLLSWPGVRASD